MNADRELAQIILYDIYHQINTDRLFRSIMEKQKPKPDEDSRNYIYYMGGKCANEAHIEFLQELADAYGLRLESPAEPHLKLVANNSNKKGR